MSSTIVRRDYKWGDKDWRSQIEETFQEKRRVRTLYTVVEALVARVSEFVFEFSDPKTGVSADSTVGPPWLFADGTYREFQAETFGLTTVKVTSYDVFSEDSYLVTADVFDPVSGLSDRARFHVSGTLPMAATIASNISRLVRRHIFGQLFIDSPEFVTSKQAVDLPWAESIEDMDRAALRLARRNNAVSRQVAIAANPLMKRGDTIRLIDPQRGIDARHLLVGETMRIEIGADQDIVVEWWPVP